MFDYHPISDKPILLQPPNQEPNRFNTLVVRAAGFLCMAAFFVVLGFLVVPMMTTSDAGGCNYTGTIPIHEPFQPVYEANCLTIGAPISQIGEEDIQGYGPRTIQYFEGALLMSDIAGNAESAEAFPLGRLLAPENGETVPSESQEAFSQYLIENGISEFLGQPVSGLVEGDGLQLAYFENGALMWDATRGRISAYSLGREHLYSNNPLLTIGAANIPADARIRSIFGTIPEYDFDMHVAYPVLYSGEQQVVTVQVVDSNTNSPAAELSLNGTVHFEDLGAQVSESFTLQATDELGIYTAEINLPQHPNGNAGRDVLIEVSYRTSSTDVITTVKKFQTWW